MIRPLPCPICGNPNPEIDTGLSDARFEREFVSCPVVHIADSDQRVDQRCPMHAEGIENWNWLAQIAASQKEAAK